MQLDLAIKIAIAQHARPQFPQERHAAVGIETKCNNLDAAESYQKLFQCAVKQRRFDANNPH